MREHLEPTAPPDALERRDRILAALRDCDTDALKEIGKDAYGQIARMRNELAPAEEQLALVQFVLQERLQNEGRSVINDPAFFIGLEELKPPNPTKNEHAIAQALFALVVDGDLLPADVVAQVVSVVEPPPPPEPQYKVNLQKLKALAKRLGAPVQAIVDQHVTYHPARNRLVFAPKEEHARITNALPGGERRTA